MSQSEDIESGKFTFSVEYDDMYEMCFISKMSDSKFESCNWEMLHISQRTSTIFVYKWKMNECLVIKL